MQLNEHYVNLFTRQEKLPVALEVFELIEQAYSHMGGNANIVSPQALCQDDGLWKLWRNAKGKIIVAMIYKDKAGRKAVALGHDGSRAAKMRVMRIFAEDIRFKRCWAEVSGDAAKFYLKAGVPIIPNRYAAELLEKEILVYHGEYVYAREIAGKPRVKVLVGYPQGMNIEHALDPNIEEVIKQLALDE